MSRTDDLAPLLAAAPTAGVGYRQGLVTAYNPDTGANTVQVAGAALADLPFLNSGDAIAIRAGDTVLLLTLGGSWFILGRIIAPGSTRFASATVSFGAFPAGPGGSVSNFAIGTTFAPVISGSIPVPPWADEALCTSIACATATNFTGSPQGVEIRTVINGQTGGANATSIETSRQDQLTASDQRVITGGSLGSSIPVTAEMESPGGVIAAHPGNIVTLCVSAIFRNVG